MSTGQIDVRQLDADRRADGTPAAEPYVAPQLIELDEVAVVTLGKYAEDKDKGRYFE
jgi:hypothetical protein